MNVREASPEDRAVWDRFVLDHPDATPYHLFAWKQAVEEAYGHRTSYLLAEDDDGPRGLLPLVLIRVPLLRRQLVSLPFCDVGGVLSRDAEATRALVEVALEQGRRLGAGPLEIRSARREPALEEMRLATARSGTEKVRMLLPLPGGGEELFGSFRSKLRSQIRKAEKNELVFVWGDRERLDDFYRVFCVNMRDLGSPVHGRALFDAILRHYGSRARLGTVLLHGEPLAAGVFLRTDRAACVPWASSRREYNRLAPNMLLYWNFLRFAADEGLECFDFGRSTVGEGTHRFKAQWGAKEAPLYWYRRGRPAAARSVPGEESGKRALAAAAWRKLPVPLANALGPRLRKYISL
jgi:FemAB-related protein (PEP-CTERM system-associated)